MYLTYSYIVWWHSIRLWFCPYFRPLSTFSHNVLPPNFAFALHLAILQHKGKGNGIVGGQNIVGIGGKRTLESSRPIGLLSDCKSTFPSNWCMCPCITALIPTSIANPIIFLLCTKVGEFSGKLKRDLFSSSPPPGFTNTSAVVIPGEAPHQQFLALAIHIQYLILTCTCSSPPSAFRFAAKKA